MRKEEQVAFFKGLMAGFPGMDRPEDAEMMASILKVLEAQPNTPPHSWYVKCPNRRCGRETDTKHLWRCQWCGTQVAAP